MNILSIYGDVLFTSTLTVLRDVVIEAIKARANLSEANLYRANLSEANLSGANLYRAGLYGANLSEANLSRANLSEANLSRANLYGANLSEANLSGANLSGVLNANLVIAKLQFIPTEGQFIGWKKCKNDVIVKLGVTKEAKRSHSTGRKCRCSRAKVLEVIGGEVGISMHDNTFTYVKGEYITPTNGFDEDRWNECGAGIHFFITREEAEAYV